MQSHADRINQRKPQFDPVPEGFRVYRTFSDVRVTVSESGHSVGLQFTGGRPNSDVEDTLLREEGFWCNCRHYRRENPENPRGNLEDVVSLADALQGLGRSR